MPFWSFLFLFLSSPEANREQFEEIFQSIDRDHDRNLTKTEFLLRFDSRRSVESQAMAARAYTHLHRGGGGGGSSSGGGGGENTNEDDRSGTPQTPNIVVENTVNFSNISAASTNTNDADAFAGSSNLGDCTTFGDESEFDDETDSTFGDTNTSFGDDSLHSSSNNNTFHTGFAPGSTGARSGGATVRLDDLNLSETYLDLAVGGGDGGDNSLLKTITSCGGAGGDSFEEEDENEDQEVAFPDFPEEGNDVTKRWSQTDIHEQSTPAVRRGSETSKRVSFAEESVDDSNLLQLSGSSLGQTANTTLRADLYPDSILGGGDDSMLSSTLGGTGGRVSGGGGGGGEVALRAEEPHELDYLEFQHKITEEAMSHGLLDRGAIEHLLDRSIMMELGTQLKRRREDGSARDKLDETILRQMCDTLLMQMGFTH